MNKILSFLATIALGFSANAQTNFTPTDEELLDLDNRNIIAGVEEMPEAGLDFDNLDLGDLDLGSLSGGFGGSKQTQVNDICSQAKDMRSKRDVKKVLKKANLKISIADFGRINRSASDSCGRGFNRINQKTEYRNCQCRSLATFALYSKDREKCHNKSLIIDSKATDSARNSLINDCMYNIGWSNTSDWAQNIDFDEIENTVD